MSKRRGRKSVPWQQTLKWDCQGYKRKRRDLKVTRAYLKYRKENGMPYRCDIEGCHYHDVAAPWFENGRPMWRGTELKFGVDHVSGNAWDNRPENLRLVCPNCAVQLPTHAGRNKNRLILGDEQSFVLQGQRGRKEITFFAEGGIVLGGSAEVNFIPAKPASGD